RTGVRRSIESIRNIFRRTFQRCFRIYSSCLHGGTRPVLVEIQALISPSSYGNPRRMATGVESNRIPLLMAVLEKRVGLMLQNQDAYIKVAGGVKLDEPAIDLAVAVSIASSFRDQPTHPEDILIGEVGLTGEV